MSQEHPIITKVFFHDTEFKTSGAVSPRPFSSITLRKSGKVLISTTDAEFVSSKNSLTFVPSGYAYNTRVLEAGEMYLLHFWLLEDGQNFLKFPKCITPPSADAFINLFERALRHEKKQDPYAVMADTYRLLSEAVPLFLENPQAPNQKMISCKKFLDDHICDTQLRVADLAALYGCSEVYFRSEFRKCYHVSPMEYIKKSRIEIACRLLETQLYPITEVAVQAGFDSISYFSAEFHRMMGCSPRDYQKR